MNDKVDLSVVISNYNTRQWLAPCLSSLRQDLQRSGIRAEIIVVDDGSSDGSAELITREFPMAMLIRNERNLGYAAANNLGMRHASGDAIFLLNADTQIGPGAVAGLLKGLSRYPQAAAVGPRLQNPDGTIQRSCWRFPGAALAGDTFLLFRLGVWDDYRTWDHREDRQVDWISSAALMIRSSALEAVGLFDEGFGLYGVDIDWALRARRRGYFYIALAAPLIVHHGRVSWQNAHEAMIRDHLRAYVRLFRKHYGLAGWILYRATLVANSSLRLLYWAAPYVLGNRRAAHKVAHFSRLLRWSLLSLGSST